MSTWKEILNEKKQMSAAEIRKAGEAALKDEREKNKKKKKEKEKSEYTEYLKKQLEFKKQKYENQKKAQLERIKKEPEKEASKKVGKALSGIKTQSISHKDPGATAYQKALGNVASLAGGVAKAAVHGVGYLAAKKRAEQKAKEAEKSQEDKKEPGQPGRPSSRSNRSGSINVSSSDTQKRLPPAPERKQISPAQPQKRLPPSGGLSRDVRRAPKAKTLGQRARQNPNIRAGLIQQRMNEKYSNWREEFLYEIDADRYATAASKSPIEKRKSGNGQKTQIIDVMKGKKNKIEMNPIIRETYKDEEGGMAHNELSTIERSVKSLRKQIKSDTKQLPAWVQSKISKAADHIDTVADYMMGSPEEVKESYDEGDETFRQHSKETFSSHQPSESRKRTAAVLKLMNQMNANAEKPKKKKKKKTVTEELGCMDDDKKVFAIMMIKKLVDEKKKKNFQLNNGIIGESKKSEMKCNKPKAEAHGSGETGKSHVVKACEGGKEELIRFGQLGVKGSPKKKGESKEYASRRKRFKARHASNIRKGKMSAAYWANRTKW